MQILLAEHQGFCYGVKRAIDLAMACIADENRRQAVHTLGPLIHNPQMVERLAQQGLRVADNIQDIPGGTVIIRSHGAGPQIYRAAEQQQLTLVDATCPHVKKAQQAAVQLAQAGYSVVVVGEHQHPEVQSICEWAGSQVQVVETAAAAHELLAIERMGIVAQTTLASELYQDIVAVLKTKCADCREVRTICTATELRQQAAVSLAGQVDAMIVIGGKNSANTARLAQLCAGKTKAVYAVETAADLVCSWFFGVNTVGITAGASTPEWLIEEVCKKCRNLTNC